MRLHYVMLMSEDKLGVFQEIHGYNIIEIFNCLINCVLFSFCVCVLFSVPSLQYQVLETSQLEGLIYISKLQGDTIISSYYACDYAPRYNLVSQDGR